MRLCLGSGTHPATGGGWVNADLPLDGIVTPDVFADAYALPFADKSFETAYLGHIAEHVERERLPAFFNEVRRVLTVGGEVVVVGPDIVKAIEQREPWHILDAISTLGSGPGAHKWCADEQSTLEAVRWVFPNVEPVSVTTIRPPEYPNAEPDALWQCAMRATKSD